MDKEQIEEFIKVVEEAIAQTNKSLEGLKQLIAESEKPELRHGDYGFLTKKVKLPRLVLKDEGGCIKYNYKAGKYSNRKEVDEPDIIFGNIFDDLAAYAEDVEEFKKNGAGGAIGFCVIKSGEVKISFYVHNSHYHDIYISMEGIKKLHRKLGAMIATAKRMARE